MFDKSFKGNVVDNEVDEVDNVVNFLDEYNFYRQKQRYLGLTKQEEKRYEKLYEWYIMHVKRF